MEKIKIDIIQLGNSRYLQQWHFIDKLLRSKKSKIFEIISIKKVSLPNAEYDWTYYDSQLSNLMHCGSFNANISIGFIDYPLEDNYFLRKISDCAAVATFFDTYDLMSEANIDPNNFILLIIYICCTVFVQATHEIEYMEDLFHDEARGCLFDMAGIKSDILLSTIHPQLCYECETRLRNCVIDKEYIPTLKRELKRIKKSRYYRIIAWIKDHPVLSIIITSVFTIILNLISSLIFQLLWNKI